MTDKYKQQLEQNGIDLERALDRFMGNEKMYEKFLRKFIADETAISPIKNYICFRKNSGLLYLVILLFNLYLYNNLADISFTDAGSMPVFREIYGKLARIDLCISSRAVYIESNIFFFAIRDRFFL